MAKVHKSSARRGKSANKAAPNTTARSTKPKDAKARKRISDTALRGVIKLVAEDPALKKAYLKGLDFSPASLKALDGLIKQLWEGQRPSDQNFDLMVWAFGAYVAEVIKRNNEGVWVKSDNVYNFVNPGGFAVNPWSWVYKRFDENDLLAPKYKIVMKMADNFAQA